MITYLNINIKIINYLCSRFLELEFSQTNLNAMYGCKSFLLLDTDSTADIVSLIKGGYEILDCNMSFQQGVDERGKPTTRVHSGTINITLSQLPPAPVIEWAMESRKFYDGMIVLVDAENKPLEKIYFENAACVGFDMRYTLSDDSYAATKLMLQAERIIVAEDVRFKNNWTY